MEDIREDKRRRGRNNNLDSTSRINVKAKAFKRFSVIIKVFQFIFTLLSWSLCSHFKENFNDHDSATIVFFLFAAVTAWIYTIFSIIIMLIKTEHESRKLLRAITIICCCLTFSVFCLITSSLMAVYARRLRRKPGFCSALKSTSCGHVEVAVSFGFFAMVSFLMDAVYELRSLQKARKSYSAAN